MSGKVREHLLGYLLGALETDEVEQVERALESDPRLRAELTRLAAHLPDLDVDREHHEPPPGLAVSTCRWLALQIDEDDDSEESLDALEPPGSRVRDTVRQEPGIRPALPGLQPVTLRESVTMTQWSFADAFVAAGILVAASFLFVPTLAHSRYAAQSQACQNNLRQIGLALAGYADIYGGYFPQIPAEGNRSFAGIFGPVLRDGTFLSDAAALSCPSSELSRRIQSWYVPTLVEIDQAREEELVELRQAAGGGYGYNLGWMSGDEYRGPRNLRRPWFAVVADTPSAKSAGLQTDNHGGRGQNVLYEDGHYRFLRCCSGADCADELFLNRAGRIAPGLDENDTVIARSETLLRNVLHRAK